MNLKKITFLSAVSLMVMGCANQSTPSMVNNSRTEMVAETYTDQASVGTVDEATLTVLAYEYGRYGSGPLDLTVTYDPKSKSFTAMKAAEKVKSLESGLRRRGVKNIKTDVLAVNDQPETLMISYQSITSRPPSDCGDMPGLKDGATTRVIGDYKFGCGIESMIARQVYRPSDLQGVGTMEHGDGRRSTNVTERYRLGTPNEPLDGLEREDLVSDR